MSGLGQKCAGGGGGCRGVTGERSLLDVSTQFQLAEGCDEAVVGPLIICQLQVPGPDHHHHVKPRLFGCFGLCDGDAQEGNSERASKWVREGGLPLGNYLLHHTDVLTSSDVRQEGDLLGLAADPLGDPLVALAFHFCPDGRVKVTVKHLQYRQVAVRKVPLNVERKCRGFTDRRRRPYLHLERLPPPSTQTEASVPPRCRRSKCTL